MTEGNTGTSLRSKEARRVRGFTLIEMVVAVSIIALLAGVATAVFRGLDDAEVQRALADCKAISKALGSYMNDTRFRPTGREGAATYWLLYGEAGGTPTNSFIAAGEVATRTTTLGTFTRTNTWNHSRWRGAYLQECTADPWRRKYVIWVRSFSDPGNKVWIVSAGRDGVLQTNYSSAALQGDDVGLCME